jgi:hypothetical protein
MKRTKGWEIMPKWIFVLLMMVNTSIVPNLPAQSPTDCPGCGSIAQALEDSIHLKAGMTRRDAEQYFSLDGGMNFRGQSRYVYKKCNMVKVEITFEQDTSVQNDFSPKDKIKSLSRLFLEFPTMD